MRTTWLLESERAGAVLFGYEGSAFDDIAARVRRRLALATFALATIVIGIALLVAGMALGVAAVAVGLLAVGFVARRLVVLAIIVLSPAMTAFESIPLARIGNDVLDVRLVLTAALGAVLWFWLAVDRPHVGTTARIFVGYVLAVMVLSAFNNVAPLLAIPVVARAMVYVGVFVGAQAWLGTRSGANAVLIAAVLGLLAPAASGVLQWAEGGALVAAGVGRITGLYGTSPVGLALAMQIGVLILAGGALTEGAARTVRWFAGILAIVVMAVLLAQTSTRLPFVTTASIVAAFEVIRRRWMGVFAVIAVAALLLISSPGLEARLGSTFGPPAGPAATAPSSPESPPPTQGTPSPVPTQTDESADQDLGGGEASYRYRLFLWRTMLGEWEASPIVGRGTGSFATLFEMRTGARRVAPHNDYLYALVEGGVVLLFLYVVLQGAVLIGLLSQAAIRSETRLSLVATGLFVATNVANAINNAIFYVDLQVIVWATAAAVLAIDAAPAGQAPDVGSSPRSWVWRARAGKAMERRADRPLEHQAAAPDATPATTTGESLPISGKASGRPGSRHSVICTNSLVDTLFDQGSVARVRARWPFHRAAQPQVSAVPRSPGPLACPATMRLDCFGLTRLSWDTIF